jgi:Helix-turn-helix.
MFRNLEAEQSRKGLTNAQMAEILCISRVTYENKKKNGTFSQSQIKAMLKLFGCTFEYLMDQENESRSA